MKRYLFVLALALLPDNTPGHGLPGQRGGDRTLAEVAGRHASGPADPLNTAALVDRLLAENSHDASPSHLARASAALAPWQGLPSAGLPPDLLLARARLHGRIHQFSTCLADLEEVLSRQPKNPHALLARATTRTSIGHYAAARDDLRRLAPLTSPVVATTALAWLDSLTGSAAPAMAQLENALRVSGRATPPGILVWAHTTAADIATRLARHGDAHRHFRAALALAPDDPHTLAAYADFLLAAGEKHKVLSIIKPTTTHPALLLRHTLAEPTPQATTSLGERFASDARAEPPVHHHRDHARFLLHLRNDPAAALHAASANWSYHREPDDVAVLLETAKAAGQPGAASSAIAFARLHRLEDARTAPLIAALTPGLPERSTLSRAGVGITFPPGWETVAVAALDSLTTSLDVEKYPDPISTLAKTEKLDAAAAHITTQLAAPQSLASVRSRLATALAAVDAATRNPDPHRVQIWDQAELRDFLKGGGQLPGYTFDFAKNRFVLSTRVTSASGALPETNTFPVPVFVPADPVDKRGELVLAKLSNLVATRRRSRTVHAGIALHEAVESVVATTLAPSGASAPTRWFAEGTANAIAASALAEIIGQPAAGTFLAPYQPERFSAVLDQVDLGTWEPGPTPADPHLRPFHRPTATAPVLAPHPGL